ncbi:hypothetical protein MTES_1196 [Microbacterium testaceum StLB037]|uniref:Uncharacterized protein n=1 Tax=Microbacterium testaceum (strain StLB037) TaxID=979556 RepID=E8N6L2_MICTS|nr:hypothetical protein [Microbacterium testaceum]BAJ74160.1 hypothetical protein MTES_1196 [Microbacterium testaceum StLB037]
MTAPAPVLHSTVAIGSRPSWLRAAGILISVGSVLSTAAARVGVVAAK